MRVKPILDSWEIKGIESITSLEDRKLAEHSIPGRVGNLFQDLGSCPTEITVTGSLHGDEVRDGFLEQIRNRFQAAQPVTFVADITTATEIQYVLVKDLHFSEVADDPDHFKYKIVLNESPPPPPPADPLGAVDADLLDQAQSLIDTVSSASEILDMLEGIPDFGDPTPPLRKSLDNFQDATSGLEALLSPLEEKV
ncbi:MAG: hypothetical protein ACFFCW_00150 [Candidatus Hodarchaeota archaeon]